MCGILGFIGNVPKEDQALAYNILSEIFLKSVIRGKDASGFAAIHYGEGGLVTEKRNVPPSKFVTRSQRWRALKKHFPNIVIAHTRKTTSGKPERNRNNHPFLTDELALIHNGKFSEWEDTVKKLSLSLRSETDSEIALRILQKYDDVHEAINTLLDTTPMSSDYALSWINHGKSKEKRKLSLFRNLGRPCVIMTFDAWDAVFFASTRYLLKDSVEAVVGKENLFDAEKEYGIKYTDLETFNLHEFYHDEYGKLKVTESKFEAPKSKVSSNVSTSSNWKGNSGSQQSTYNASNTINSTVDNKSSKIEIYSEKDLDDLDVSDEVKQEVIELEISINDAMKIAKLIGEETHMTSDEYQHFMDWALRV